MVRLFRTAPIRAASGNGIDPWPRASAWGFMLVGVLGTSLVVGAFAPKFLPEFMFMLFEVPERTFVSLQGLFRFRHWLSGRSEFSYRVALIANDLTHLREARGSYNQERMTPRHGRLPAIERRSNTPDKKAPTFQPGRAPI